MKYEIDIDLGRLADEWEPVAFRSVAKNEFWLSPCGKEVRGSSYADAANGPRLIVRRRWHWPEWLTAEWIAMDERGVWFAYLNEPSHGVNSWCGGQCVGLSLGLLKFDAPTCTDWRQSKRRNPRAT